MQSYEMNRLSGHVHDIVYNFSQEVNCMIS